MENASKALIIAGAILLSILIISLGIMIFRQASGVINNNAMDELEVTQFNQRFEQYFGDNVRGANVNALISAVDSNNRTYADDDSKIVKIYNGSGTTEWTGKAKTGLTYKVEEASKTSGGLISGIRITVNTSK